MSIIQEALRKAESVKDRAPLEPPKDLPRELKIIEEASISNAKPVAGKHRAITIAFFAICSALLLFSIWQFSAIRQAARQKKGVVAPQAKTVIKEAVPTLPKATVPEMTAAAITPSPSNIPAAASTQVKEKEPGWNFVLNGIMYLEEGPQAIINNSIVTEGSEIEGTTVVKIDPNSVVLNANGGKLTLRLK